MQTSQPHRKAKRDSRHHQVAEAKHGGSASQSAQESPRVTFSGGKLTVEARNSDLGAILGDVARLCGTNVNGVDTGTHVFGVYGPGNPRQVLTELLDGLGYNYMMVGNGNDGAPQELILTARSTAPPTPPSSSPANAQKAEPADDADDQEPPGPGAIIHVPPSVAQQADDSQTQQRVQQNLQRLEKMQQQMQRQNQPQ